MKDMLVRLLELPDVKELEDHLKTKFGIIFKRPIAPEKTFVKDWVNLEFGPLWADEVEVAFSRMPVTCWVAQEGNHILGFACYECTARNFFGPTGTMESARGQGIGKVLLIKSLESMREMGYAYAIIGGVGPESFYEKAVQAKVIKHSDISIYQNLLKKP
ncbi:GNAT family N-acetyltransferase [Pararhodonellum marinum]|uniref:GNAT family N-acetyltransferase n=1 Tax=Pararhodonellum marinum TaxID=2755358 RepID=UPI00188E56D1|nr:GNAT family N-acetyltransferase [Pararhodonellum marinum]